MYKNRELELCKMAKSLRQNKYQIIVDSIKEDILSGRYRAGDKLPSETQLMGLFDVSRITARNALCELEGTGHIYKLQGKGCFVDVRREEASLLRIHSYTQEVLATGMTLTRKIINSEVRKCTVRESALLHLSNNSVFFIERVYYADNKPLCLTCAVMPYNIFTGIDQLDFQERSLYSTFRNNYNIEMNKTTLSLEAVCASSETAQKMGIETGTPLLHSEALSYAIINNREVPVEFSVSYHLTSTMKYNIEQKAAKIGSFL